VELISATVSEPAKSAKLAPEIVSPWPGVSIAPNGSVELALAALIVREPSLHGGRISREREPRYLNPRARRAIYHGR
jgi:hypothetical protein